MRTFAPALAAAMILAASLPRAIGQDASAGMKHLTVAARNAGRPVLLSALSIERELHYPSVVNLNGNVEIRMPLCLRAGENA